MHHFKGGGLFFLPDFYVSITSSLQHFLFACVYVCLFVLGVEVVFCVVSFVGFSFLFKLLSCVFEPSSTVDKEGLLLPTKVKAIIFLPPFDSEII